MWRGKVRAHSFGTMSRGASTYERAASGCPGRCARVPLPRPGVNVLLTNILPEQPTILDSDESTQAIVDIDNFLESEIGRIEKELADHKISSERIRALLPKLENLTTIEIDELEFVIYRNISNGFDIRWKNEQQKAA